jgi:hypothetical protein
MHGVVASSGVLRGVRGGQRGYHPRGAGATAGCGGVD